MSLRTQIAVFSQASGPGPRSAKIIRNGGYLSGHARHRLLSVAAFSSAFVLGWQSSAADRLGEHGQGLVPCPWHDPVGGTHKGLHCQEGVRIWPGGYVRRQAGLTVLLDPSS